jgi:uncharacterized protein involved in type VI secretion and phage assembly
VRFDFNAVQSLTQPAVRTQYCASDLEFFTRLLADERLSFRFEHEYEGASATPSNSQSKPASSFRCARCLTGHDGLSSAALSSHATPK